MAGLSCIPAQPALFCSSRGRALGCGWDPETSCGSVLRKKGSGGRQERATGSSSSVAIYSSSRSHAVARRWPSESVNRRTGGSGVKVGAAGLIGQAEEEEAVVESPPSSSEQLVEGPRMAADVVQEFYDSFNRRDVLAVANLFAQDCEYEDFNFPGSAKGREAVLKFIEKMVPSFGSDLKFVIDDMTHDDPNAVGVIWHLDWRGKAFPFSKGCSFYRCEVNSNGQRQIKYARDIVEPASRPGNAAIGVLKLVTALFERFPQLANRL